MGLPKQQAAQVPKDPFLNKTQYKDSLLDRAAITLMVRLLQDEVRRWEACPAQVRQVLELPCKLHVATFCLRRLKPEGLGKLVGPRDDRQ